VGRRSHLAVRDVARHVIRTRHNPILLVLTALALSVPSSAQSTTRAAHGVGGAEPNDVVDEPNISSDGRWIAFQADASNLVPGDSNGVLDVFLLDRLTGQQRRVSQQPDGTQLFSQSFFGWMAADGDYLVFRSAAGLLVPGDTNNKQDVFRYRLADGSVERISLGDQGQEANGDCKHCTVSADGNICCFRSSADNLVPNDMNGVDDIFVRDVAAGTTVRVSVASDGTEGNGASAHAVISFDGKWATFRSFSDNFGFVDTNGVEDVYIHELATGTTLLVSHTVSGVAGAYESTYPSLSEDGRFVAFMSYSPNLVMGQGHDINEASDIFVWDRETDTTDRISHSSLGELGNEDSYYPNISRDGRFVAFASDASNLVPDDTNGFPDVFVHDRETGVTERVSTSTFGQQGAATSYRPTISGDGRYVAFASSAMNLVPSDTNNTIDIFVHDRHGPFATLPGALAGANGAPQLQGEGQPEADTLFGLVVHGAAPDAACYLVAGFSILDVPFGGGTLVPAPDMMIIMATDATGFVNPQAAWPPGVPEGLRIYFQAWVADDTGPQGYTASDAVWMITP
jgi:Tol biopolymer transport system component